MEKNKKDISILIAVIVIAGLFGYWFYASKKGGTPSVSINENFKSKYLNNTSTTSVIPNSFSTTSTTSTNSLISNMSSTGKVTLSWNPNKEADLAGYKIYYGLTPRTGNCPPGGYSQKVDVGNKISYTIDKLENGKIYYFSITSYDKSGNESCFSAEVKKIIQK